MYPRCYEAQTLIFDQLYKPARMVVVRVRAHHVIKVNDTTIYKERPYLVHRTLVATSY
jgi:hypothetical protein